MIFSNQSNVFGIQIGPDVNATSITTHVSLFVIESASHFNYKTFNVYFTIHRISRNQSNLAGIRCFVFHFDDVALVVQIEFVVCFSMLFTFM